MGGAPLRPELISELLVQFGLKHGIEIRYTQLGKPMQNGLVEQLNRIIRIGCLNLRVFKTVRQVHEALDEGGIRIILIRPISSLKYQTLGSVCEKGPKF